MTMAATIKPDTIVYVNPLIVERLKNNDQTLIRTSPSWNEPMQRHAMKSGVLRTIENSDSGYVKCRLLSKDGSDYPINPVMGEDHYWNYHVDWLITNVIDTAPLSPELQNKADKAWEELLD